MKNILIPFVALLLFLTALIVVAPKTGELVGGSGGYQKASYDLIGTAANFATMTTSTYTTTTLFANKLENLHLDVGYAPGDTNQYLQIEILGSNDEGVNFFPITSKVIGTTEINVYGEDASGNAIGIPIIFPGDKTSVTTTEYLGAFDTDMIADVVLLKVKEVGNSAGSGYVRATVTSKN